MENTLSLLSRGLLLGGGFGIAIGQLLGQFTENQWQWISNLMLGGAIVGLVSCLVVVLNNPTYFKRSVDISRRVSNEGKFHNLKTDT